MNIYAYMDGFWVLESNKIHPEILYNKYITFSRDNEDIRWGED